jgi:hypothetical protein
MNIVNFIKTSNRSRSILIGEVTNKNAIGKFNAYHYLNKLFHFQFLLIYCLDGLKQYFKIIQERVINLKIQLTQPWLRFYCSGAIKEFILHTSFMMIVKKLLGLFIFVLLTNHKSFAQPHYFRHYQVEDGLSNNTVYCTLQDKNGFLWMGTKEGLNRFDGIISNYII